MYKVTTSQNYELKKFTQEEKEKNVLTVYLDIEKLRSSTRLF